MSSRVIRRADLPGDDAQPIQWRPHGPAAEVRTAGTQPARGPATAVSADDPQVRQLCANAYQQGVAAGEAAAGQRAQTKLDPALASFTKMVAELQDTKQKLRAEAETAAVALAIEVARRVLHREIAADPEALLGLVKAAFQKCDARGTQRLRISPADAETIREHQQRLNFPPALELIPDPDLPRGSAIFETSRGDLDASVDTQLAEIERGLTDVVKRRHS